MHNSPVYEEDPNVEIVEEDNKNEGLSSQENVKQVPTKQAPRVEESNKSNSAEGINLEDIESSESDDDSSTKAETS
ncbi:hypothetical protein A2U01_0070086, partial [Trifolium medium]|nr:hypothetical protein [Trifolium medium]